MAIIIDWKIVSQKNIKDTSKKKVDKKDRVWLHIWFIWDREDWFPLYKGYIKEDLWDKLKVIVWRADEDPSIEFVVEDKKIRYEKND